MTDARLPPALEDRDAKDGRLYSPSAARNRDAILAAFMRHVSDGAAVLEVGSGTGEHAAHLAAAMPRAQFFPGDPDPSSRISIAAWTGDLPNVAPPHALDVTDPDWTKGVERRIDAILSINMIHIAPFAAARGLFSGAGAMLPPEGVLFLYGPFARDGRHTAPSNAAFDASLKDRNPLWGVRDLERDLAPLAHDAGLRLNGVIAMPANNFSVVFRKRAISPAR